MNPKMNLSTGAGKQNIIPLKFAQSYHYPVCFTRDLFHINNQTLMDAIGANAGSGAQKTLVFMDEGVIKPSPGLLKRMAQWFEHHKAFFHLLQDPAVFPGGEGVKNSWDHVHRTTRIMNDSGMDRHGLVIAVGGGALLDMIGFSAAVFHRGIRLIRIPTTTLAQNDAGIGVKNGINQYGRKNCIGTFYLPAAVINDFDFLKTLPFEHFIGGVAEAFKIALIRDSSFFAFLEDHGALLKQRDTFSIEETIERCARLHLEHIAGSGDPFETGSSRPLDYGHWSAHKIEILSGFSLGHGQAVSIGISLDSFYAWKRSLISRTELDRILTALIRCGLPVWSNHLENRDGAGRLEIENGLEEFRQHLGGRLTFTMPAGIGHCCELHEMDFDMVREGISFLKNLGSGSGASAKEAVKPA
jgi:3-dehydroquinate synthase